MIVVVAVVVVIVDVFEAVASVDCVFVVGHGIVVVVST